VSSFLVIPAIDIRSGRCVRLYRGDFSAETIYHGDPVHVASEWVRQGAKRLHLVDLDGARTGTSPNAAVIARILATVPVPCQVGGGIRTRPAIEELLEQGARWIVVGTRALEEPTWLREVATSCPDRILLALDVLEGRPMIRGWQDAAASPARVILRQVADLPLAGICYTAVDRDGTLAGPAWDELQQLGAESPHPLIASGGIQSAADIFRLAQLPLAGCIVGKALYEGLLSLPAALEAAEAGRRGQPLGEWAKG
jgi:phosphoribosylformimino-5-aminoimidazole carboxamide ribotide isomerase